ncbi:MAG: CaiB/BaiF CoA-transferase family protein, partial [Desulfobacterales bacterium]|nr:CaiB/BaiF CoA-transferase family protein [Desulfobacterales bacterium]
GTMAKLNLAYTDLMKVNAGLIYCSLNSYGYSGPDRDKVAHDVNILAQVGMLDLMGPADGPPIIPGVQLVDTVTALYAVIGIQGALAIQARTGKGQHVDLSMHDCAFSLMFDSIRYPLGEGRLPQRGRERLMGGLANYGIYESRDGRYMVIGAIEKKYKNTLLKILGLEAFLEEGGAVTASEVDVEKEEALKAVLSGIFKQKDLKHWKEILGPANVFFSAVDTIEDALQDRQLKSRSMIHETRHPVAGKYVQIGSPVKLSETPVDLERRPAPRLGENTAEILRELGFSGAEIADLDQNGTVRTFK